MLSLKINSGIILFSIILCGCSTLPFKHSSYISFKEVNPEFVLSSFADKLPKEYEIFNSVVFRYFAIHYPALGVVHLSQETDRISIAGFNHLGVMLFDISSSSGILERSYVFPGFAQYKDFASQVISDVTKIYLNLLPSPLAQVKKEKFKIIFKDILEDSVTEFVFSGEGFYLSEKHYHERKRRVWSVFYYDYRIKDGKIYPHGIIFKHFKYGYKLIIRLKGVY